MWIGHDQWRAQTDPLHFSKEILYNKDLFTHKNINTYINGVVKICLNKFLKVQVSKRKEKNMKNYSQVDDIDHYSLHKCRKL